MAIDKSRKFIALVRLGYAARGLTYVLLGTLALGTSGKAVAGAQGVFDYLQEMTLGRPLLGVVAIGLLAYAIFRILSAVANLENHRGDALGIAKRLGELGSGAIHIALAFAAYSFASGGDRQAGGSGASAEMVRPVMDFELGPLLIGLIGSGMLMSAAMQARHAATGDFMRHVAARAPRAIETIGRIGHAARAVVFAVIGWSLVRAAWFSSEKGVKGLGEALLSLRDNGPLYSLVAIGLLMFGAFSLVTARHRIIADFHRGDLKPSLQRD